MKTDYIDLYQLHWPERKSNYFGRLGYEHKKEDENWNNFEEILNSLDKIIKSGKIRYIAMSNETPWGLSKFLEISNQKKLPRIMSVQNPYSLLNRTYEVGLAEISVREQSGLLAYSPLAFGFLTGKYRNNQLPEGSRMNLFGDIFPRYKTTNGQKAIEEYYKIAKKHNLNFAQMSLKFIEIQPFVTSVIIGATTMEQLKTNIESVNVNLTKEIIKEINEVQNIYPNPCP
jgi:aryl-alcohol dehydrogenase-like predicted oxidoreductase